MILYDVIDYIKDCTEADTDLPTDGIPVLESYKYSHKCNNTEIQVQILDHKEYQRFTTFEDGKIYVAPLQFEIYAKQMTIGNELVSAQKAAYILAEKVVGYLNVNDVNAEISDVLSIRNGTYSQSLPLDTGTNMYVSIVRVDFYLKTV